MVLDSSSLQSGSKRVRAEDEVYLDNFHVHKRYLSEVMASSLNGLKVGDSFSGGSKVSPQTFEPMDSPALTETAGVSKSLSSYPSNGDELSTLDSYMSDDSDDSICYRTGRYCETPQRTFSSLSDSSRAASPLKSSKGPFGGNNAVVSAFSLSSMPLPCTQPKQRVPDAESRFPPSPSDPCYAADLRRAALLRSLQLRAQSPVAISDAAAVDEAVDECLDTCEHHLAEAEDQCSPCSPNLDELAAEQTACNHDMLGSPVHGTYPGQAGRGSGLVRSLLLDGCTNLVPEACSDVVQGGFTGAASTVDSTTLQIDKLHSMGMNLECSYSSLYTEEVSDSTDKTESAHGTKWSSRRGDRLCSYFYKGSLGRDATEEDL
ncbi:hypothetical protein GOP47_0013603 [Adiantum capillus-veneris]|uniref:Uncharacterized protein n=1 Tax=Adiantum capillus-veneris TaxID=13818 RepID=A0A9D4UPT3_ADICA|nr:hypothetical protein GOP47_0013603 [Adiantum capillus-veneris]